jgi:hypothetical protein
MSPVKTPQHHNSTEKMLSTADLATRLNVSTDTALRIMRATQGVLRFGTGSRSIYRMPEPTFNAFVARTSVNKAGRR